MRPLREWAEASWVARGGMEEQKWAEKAKVTGGARSSIETALWG